MLASSGSFTAGARRAESFRAMRAASGRKIMVSETPASTSEAAFWSTSLAATEAVSSTKANSPPGPIMIAVSSAVGTDSLK